ARLGARCPGWRERGGEPETKPAVVGRVLAERQLSVDMHVVDGDEAVVFVDEALRAALEVLRVLGRPPVVQVALRVVLTSLIVEPVRQFMADDGARGAEIGRPIASA